MPIIERTAVGVRKALVTSCRESTSSWRCGSKPPSRCSTTWIAPSRHGPSSGAMPAAPPHPPAPGDRPLADAVEALAVPDLVAVDELLVGEQVAVRVDDALGQAGRAARVVELRG